MSCHSMVHHDLTITRRSSRCHDRVQDESLCFVRGMHIDAMSCQTAPGLRGNCPKQLPRLPAIRLEKEWYWLPKKH